MVDITGAQLKSFSAYLSERAASTTGVSKVPGLNAGGSVVATQQLIVFADDYGAGTAKTGAQNATAIQAAIDFCDAAGGGIVDLGSGEYTSNPLVLPNAVIIRGKGSSATCLKLANGQNAAFIVSDDFATLTGSNTWLVSLGMKYGLGLVGLRIDGNKANNNSSADGVKIYAKRVYFDDVIIENCKGRGWYSEGADIPGQVDWKDLPESWINVWVRGCDDDGFVFRGPHDARVSIIANACVGSGARFEIDSGVYNGSADVHFAHIYANGTDGSDGFYTSAQIRCLHLISESNYAVGVNWDTWYGQIALLQTYDNCRTAGTYNFIYGGRYNQVAQWQHRNISYFKSGLHVTGLENTIDDLHADGGATGGTSIVGVTIDDAAAYTRLKGRIRSWAGTTSTGLITNNGGAASFCDLDLHVTDCLLCWNNAAEGYGSTYKLTLRALTGQTAFTGNGPPTATYTEKWEIIGLEGASTVKASHITKASGATIDLNSTAEQSISIGCSELLGLAPPVQNVQASIAYTGANTTWALQYLRVASTTASNVNFTVKLSTAAGSAQTGNILMRAGLTP